VISWFLKKACTASESTYARYTLDEMLPRYSSPNFEQGDIGEPVLEVGL
jgi:hypothetical protein